jgi:hypothetical protein
VVLRILPGPPRRGQRRGRYALLLGWPTPVPEWARTVMPPVPGRPVRSRAARQWAKRQLQRNGAGRHKAPRDLARYPWIGAYSLRWLRAVAAGTQPLPWGRYASLCRYWGIEGFPKAAPRGVAVPATRLQVAVGGGAPTLRWRA